MKKKILLTCLSLMMSLSLVTTKVFGSGDNNSVTQFNIGTYRYSFKQDWTLSVFSLGKYSIPVPWSKYAGCIWQVELDSYYATGTVTMTFNSPSDGNLGLYNLYVYGADIFSWNSTTRVLKVTIEDIRSFEVALVCENLTASLAKQVTLNSISGSGTAMSTPNEIKQSIDYITAGKTVSLSNIKTAIEALNVIDNNIMGANSKTLSDLYSKLVDCYNCLHGTYDGDSKTVTDLLNGIDHELTDVVWDVNAIKDFLVTDTSDYYESVTTFLDNFDIANFKAKLNNISSKMDSLVSTVNNIDSLIDTITWKDMGSNYGFLGYSTDGKNKQTLSSNLAVSANTPIYLHYHVFEYTEPTLIRLITPFYFSALSNRYYTPNLTFYTLYNNALYPIQNYEVYCQVVFRKSYIYYEGATSGSYDLVIKVESPYSGYLYSGDIGNTVSWINATDIEYWTLKSVINEFKISDNIEELCNYSSQALSALEVLKTNTANTVTSLNEIKALIQSFMPLNNSIDTISWNKIADFVKWDTQQGNSGTATASNLPSGTRYEFTAITNRTLNTGLFKLHLTVSASQLDSSTFKVYALANNTYNITNPTIYYIQKGRVWTDVYFDFTDSWSSNPDGYQKIVIQLNVISAFFSGYSDSALYFLSSDNIDYWDIMQVLTFKQMMSVTSSDSDYDTRIFPLLNDGTSESNTAKTSLASMVASLTEKNNAVEGAINTRETQYLTEMETFENLIHSDLGDIAEVTVTATWLKTKLESLYSDLDLWRLTISTPLNLALLGSIIGIRKRDEEK